MSNVLLQKTELGKVKKGFHDLPQTEHVYGKAPAKDKHGAREVISGWEQHKGSASSEASKNFIAMNKEGLKQGFIDSKVLLSSVANNRLPQPQRNQDQAERRAETRNAVASSRHCLWDSQQAIYAHQKDHLQHVC